MSAPSLHRESTDSLIFNLLFSCYATVECITPGVVYSVIAYTCIFWGPF